MLLAAHLKIAALAIAVAASPMAATVLDAPVRQEPFATVTAPELVKLKAGSVRYSGAGEFIRDGKPVDAPAPALKPAPALSIMKYQVTQRDYRRCAANGGCPPPATASPDGADLPAVMVSWRDAEAYARWLSGKLGANYRLPTDGEWTFAAASRAPGELPALRGNSDPVARWLARYEREIEGKPVNAKPMPLGSFGVNENGIADLAGNVWEWTSTCFTRSVLTDSGPRVVTTNCGVRVAEGRHRAFVTDFIRDARGGGCASGVPPANLGFRLVRDDDTALSWLDKIWRIAAARLERI